jgi:hypothetical protein
MSNPRQEQAEICQNLLVRSVTGLPYIGQWNPQFVSQMISERNDVAQRREPFAWSDFLPQFLPSTFENWQSIFLQLLWQAAGLAMSILGLLSLQGERRPA